jgi:hypothetical protein
MKPKSPAAQLAGFLAKFTPDMARLGKTVLARLRQLLPPAIEMVYDNYNFLVVGFGPTERPSEAVFSIAMYARGVGLCFLDGARLPDPHGLLLGGGKQVRHIKVPTAATLDDPRVRELIAVALKTAPVKFDGTIRRRRLVIKSISAKQRPRRPAAGKKNRARK